MPCAWLKATAIVRNEPPTAMSQPVRASARRSRLETSTADAGDDREAEQPAGLPAERVVEQAQRAGLRRRRGRPDRRRPHRPDRPRRRRGRRPGRTGARGRCSRGSATRSLLSAVPEIHGRSDAGVSATSNGQAPPTTTIAAAAGEQLADGGHPAARRDPQPRRRERRDHEQRGRHLGLEAEPDADAGEHEPARPAVLQAAHQRPQGARSRRARAARRGCCGARSPRSTGVSASTSPPAKPAARPKRRRTRS